jgi:hypothetical protein
VLSEQLTADIDAFLLHWRPLLRPGGAQLFAQAKTGKPLSQDSMYQIVTRAVRGEKWRSVLRVVLQ